MGKIKIRKKDLKKDEVGEKLLRWVQWIRDHGRLLVIAIVLIGVVCIAALIVQYRKNVIKVTTNTFYKPAAVAFEMALMEEEEEERTKLFQASIDRCDRIINEFGGAPLTRNARRLKASAYYYMNSFDPAITEYQQIIETAKGDLEKAAAYKNLGYCFENKYFNQQEDLMLLEQAIGSYETAIELGKDSYIAYDAMLAKARLLELQFKNQEAIEVVEKIAEARTPEKIFNDPVLPDQPSIIDLMLNQLRARKIGSLFGFAQTAQLATERLKGE